MAYEYKEGQGSLFSEQKQNDRQPDYRGTILIEGKTYDLAAWGRTSKAGSQYISLQATLRKSRASQELGQDPNREFGMEQGHEPQPEAQPVPQYGFGHERQQTPTFVMSDDELNGDLPF